MMLLTGLQIGLMEGAYKLTNRAMNVAGIGP